MSNKLSHFAIFMTDADRAKTFYNKVFKWNFNGYGGNDFAQINTESGELIGAIQDRKYQLTDELVIGFECSISVANIDQTTEDVLQAGGQVLMPKTEIPRVGQLIKFQDTEGNIVCAIQYFQNLPESTS